MTLTVSIVTQDDPFYVPWFFKEFFEAVSDNIEITSVTILRSFDESMTELAKRMYGFYGPSNFVRRCVEFAYRRLSDQLGHRNFSVTSVAQEYNIPVNSRDTVCNAQYINDVASEVDVILSVSAPEIFGEDLLDAPEWGCINVHTAALPKYRGMMPTFWALYHGEDSIGVTVHTMEEKIDSGKAICRDSFDVPENATLEDVIVMGKRIGGLTAACALKAIENGTYSQSPITGEESYFSFPTVEERQEFQQRGNQLL